MAFTEELEETEKDKKQRKKLKDSGILSNGCFEAVYDSDKPYFLRLNGGSFSLVETIEFAEETISPKERQNIPYEPYGYCKQETPGREELARQVRNEFETWIDVEPIWKTS